MSKFDRTSRFEQESSSSGRRRTLAGAGRKLSWDVRPLEALLTNPPEELSNAAQKVKEFLEWRTKAFAAVRSLGEKLELLNSRYMSGAKIVGQEVWEKLPAAIETLTQQRAALHDGRKEREKELGKDLLGVADIALRLDVEEREKGRGPLDRERIEQLFDDLGSTEELQEASRLANSVAILLYELELAENVPKGADGKRDYAAVLDTLLKRGERQFFIALLGAYQGRKT